MEHNEKPISAVEKAKLLKKQIEDKKAQEESLLKEQESQKTENIHQEIDTLKAEITELKKQKQELEQQEKEVLNERKQANESIKQAIHELHGSEETRGLLKDKETQTEIFGDDRKKRNEALTKSREIRSSISDIESKIQQQEQKIEDLTKLTPEGKKIEVAKMKQELLKSIDDIYSKKDSLQEKAQYAKERINENKKALEQAQLQLIKTEAMYSADLNENLEINSDRDVVISKYVSEVNERKNDAGRLENMYSENQEARKKIETEGYSKGLMDRFTKKSKDEYDSLLSQNALDSEKIRKEMDENFRSKQDAEKKSKIQFEFPFKNDYLLSYTERDEFLKTPKTLKEYLVLLDEKSKQEYTPSKDNLEAVQQWEDAQQQKKDLELKMKELDPSWKSPDEARESFVQSDKVAELIESLKIASSKSKEYQNKIKDLYDRYPNIQNNYPDLVEWRKSMENFQDQKKRIMADILELGEKEGVRKDDVAKFIKEKVK